MPFPIADALTVNANRNISVTYWMFGVDLYNRHWSNPEF